MSDRRYGCVLFDDPNDPSSGWAAVPGGKPGRVGGWNELATDTIWWTNVPYDMFYRRTEVWRVPTLRHDKYLVVSPQDVLREWGYDPATVEPGFTAEMCAMIFERIMRMSWMLLSEVNPKMRVEQAFTGKTLREDLRPLLPELDYPKGEAATVMKSGQAWEEFTATGAKGPKGGRWVMLRRPRLQYAMHILQTPVPKAPFEFVSRADLRRETEDRVKYVLEHEQPMMVEVNIYQMQQEIAPIYGFGNAIDKDKKVPRSWVAHPEFTVLAKHADLEVRGLWKGREYWALVPDLPQAVKDFLSDKYSDFSWTAGVIAETLWRSVVLGEDKAKAGPLRDGEERAQTSWPGLWMRAHDKASMFSVSLRLAELGYAVLSYGLGWVRCCVGEDEIAQLMKDGLSLGLMPQLVDVPEGVWRGDQIGWGGDRGSQLLAGLTMTRQSPLIWNLDKIPLLPPERRKDAVKKFNQHNAAA